MFFKEILQENLNEHIIEISSLSGGDINEAYKISTEQNSYALKINSQDRFPEMFVKEKLGLETISATGATSPKVIQTWTGSEKQFLLMEFVEEQTAASNFWENFSRDLAKIHRVTDTEFGLPYDNYIGSLCQINTQKSTWDDFFIAQRLLPLVEQAFDQQLLNRSHLQSFDKFFNRLNEILPAEKPALVHGDLWAGNLMKAIGQQPVFIDPAIYFGNREMDIAMTQMFGGFDPSFLDYYHEVFPLENNWEERVSIHNLYPTLVHLILFGRSYLGAVERVVKKF